MTEREAEQELEKPLFLTAREALAWSRENGAPASFMWTQGELDSHHSPNE